MPATVFLNSLNSFFNLSRAVLQRTHQEKQSTSTLGDIVGLSHNSVRNRYQNPKLWRISEIRLLATHYHLPTRSCVQMHSTVADVVAYLQQLPSPERRQVERLCQIKTVNMAKRLDDDWSLLDLEKLQIGFQQWVIK
ncbi:helix-turn-helix domain-containing protein [Spirosoma litoris]